jgi:glycosyltransferase involved in cell wall biosynthesis
MSMPVLNTDPTIPRVSIILPTYNRAGLVGRAITSVLAQTLTDFELIVVDDGSRDETGTIVGRFAHDPRVRYFPLPANRGAGAARNVGVGESRGRFIAFQDSDDEWLPDKLERHVEAFASAPDVGVVYSDMQRVLSDGTTKYHGSPRITDDRLLDPARRFYHVCGLGIQSTVVRRECFDLVGMFNEAFPALEDLELFIRLSRRVRFLHLPLPLVRYHETNGLSKNVAAKLTARRLLLSLYERDLAQADPSFPKYERRMLDAVERKPTRGV